MIKIRLLLVFSLSFLLLLPSWANGQSVSLNTLPRLANMQQAGLLLLDAQGEPLISKQASQLFVPASTTKLVTAYLALSHWGEAHQFKTDFFLQSINSKTILWVKGYGDPFLISEELLIIAQQLTERLTQQGLQRIDEIRLDTTVFSNDLMLPGTSQSDNPYDAVPSAIAANFNTLYLMKHSGQLVSAEAQTPLTPLALEVGQSLTSKKQRINLGADPKVGQRYFAELLAEFLRQQGVEVGETITWGEVNPTLPRVYQHTNSHSLADIIRPMMKYSTNFIANQLVLMMATERYGAPATTSKVKQFFLEQLASHFEWSGTLLEEGAGLSRNNRLSPEQLIDLLQAFKPWRDLLPEIETGVMAKSGSLIGVSTLAGYILQDQDWLPFALMMNERAPYRYRNKVARQLQAELNR